MSPLLLGALALAGIMVASRAMASRDFTAPGMTELGPAALLVALEELEVQVSEDLGHNDGQRIRLYWEGTGLGPPSNWCAAFTRWCLHRAAERTGLPLTVQGSPGAKATMEQFRAAGRWIPVEALRRWPELLQPGMVPVWDRSVAGRPETSWWGHIGFCSEGVSGGAFATVEGNSGATGTEVAAMARTLGDPRLLGAGVP